MRTTVKRRTSDRIVPMSLVRAHCLSQNIIMRYMMLVNSPIMLYLLSRLLIFYVINKVHRALQLYHKLYRKRLPSYFEMFLPEHGAHRHDFINDLIRRPAIILVARCDFKPLDVTNGH